AEAVKAAIDRHLDAVERRTGDDDPAVYEAFNGAAAAAPAPGLRRTAPGVPDSVGEQAGSEGTPTGVRSSSTGELG
ncbi:hypothetical protein ABZZ78_35600, partial [Streptomyces sp. NPDC006415]